MIKTLSKKIAVVGAGITGITTAYYLVNAGYEVEVYEEERHSAMKASYANGGQISVSNSEVWTTWSNVKKGIKWIFRKDAPLLIRLTPSWSKIKWLSKFLYYTARGDYRVNTGRTIYMGLASRILYQDIIKKENLSFDQSNSGILHFYKTSSYFDAAKEVKDLYNQCGCEWSILNPVQIKDLDPTLSRINAIGGAWTKDDWTGDIHKFCIELAKILEEKYKVRFRYKEKFSSSFIKDYSAVVICAGVGSVKLAKEFGDDLPIYPVKGYSITINNVDPNYLPKVSLLDDQAKIVTSSLGNRLRVAGTAELDGENYDIRRDRIEPLLRWVHANFPHIDTNDYSSWACLRPMTPNMMPIVKQSAKNEKVFYNTGHGHLGWTLSPYTATEITKIIQNTL